MEYPKEDWDKFLEKVKSLGRGLFLAGRDDICTIRKDRYGRHKLILTDSDGQLTFFPFVDSFRTNYDPSYGGEADVGTKVYVRLDNKEWEFTIEPSSFRKALTKIQAEGNVLVPEWLDERRPAQWVLDGDVETESEVVYGFKVGNEVYSDDTNLTGEYILNGSKSIEFSMAGRCEVRSCFITKETI